MKNKFLLLTLSFTFFLYRAQAQVVNASFENWQVDTNHFAGYLTLPAATFPYTDPVGWTSTNSITKMPALGQLSFVTQSGNAYTGQSAVQLITDTINAGGTKVILPGFLLNGNFPLSVTNLVVGANITPTSVKGAGQPFTQRLLDFKGYYNYTPVLNPHTNANDTCLIWATLRKGPEIIANAIFKSTTNTDGYQQFSANFNYLSCDMPDTLVILISSSIPNLPSLFNSSGSNLTGGSVLLVDTLSYDTLPANHEFSPIAISDTASTIENTAKDIYVKANDLDCNYPVDSLNIHVSTQALHGTVTVNANNYIVYTPNTNFVGSDTFWYTLSDTVLTSNPAEVIVVVHSNAGIKNIGEIPVTIYPVPVSNELHIQFENPGKSTARVYDVTGQLVGSYMLDKNNNSLNVAAFTSGFYLLQIVNGENTLLASNRFVVCK